MKKLIILSLSSLILYGCAKRNIPVATKATPEIKPEVVSSPRSETSNDTPPASETATDEAKKNQMILVENGKKVFESSCNKCHELKVPGNYTQLDWVKLVEKMAPMARLTEQGKKECLTYLQYNAKDAPKDK